MKSLAYKDVVTTVFYLLILLLGWFVKGDFNEMKTNIRDLTTSVQTLNVNMAASQTQQQNHGYRIEGNTIRIERLEKLHQK